MTKLQLAFGLVTVALLGAILLVLVSPKHALGAVFPGDPSISVFTRLAANDFINGGVETVGNRALASAATTTPCAIQSPAATSTLALTSILLNVSSTTASTVTIATSTTAFATTTQLYRFAVAANASAVAQYAPTTTQAAIFAPSTWVVFSMEGGTGTFSPSGVCTATFTTLN